jgi:hypothetical protein
MDILVKNNKNLKLKFKNELKILNFVLKQLKEKKIS